MGTCYGYSISTLSSLCVASIVVVFMLLEHFGALMNISGSKSEFSIPMVELQKKVTGDDQVRALRTAGSDTGFDVNRLGNRARKKAKLSRKQELEQGLARARASIRAASKLNLSATVNGDVDYIPFGVVYRNAGAFYQ
ncbi:hypothetical protein CJ030_MR8G012717 [Morella rubra]|uniref:Uncharacterized protein n=1 Tax=Morella rubra TaxID=262757 RepID=A0A6A1UW49_9ROSI|nr:hypothetical protein CJ030_MR8G012717 [Morella rubra]